MRPLHQCGQRPHCEIPTSEIFLYKFAPLIPPLKPAYVYILKGTSDKKSWEIITIPFFYLQLSATCDVVGFEKEPFPVFKI